MNQRQQLIFHVWSICLPLTFYHTLFVYERPSSRGQEKGVLMTKKYSFSWSNNLSQLFWRPIGRLWLTYSSSSFPQRQFLLWRTEGKVISRFFVSHFMTQCLALKWTIQIHFNFNLWINFFKMRHSRSRFLFFLYFQHSWKYIGILLMTGFEPWTSGFGSNRSTNCATTTDCPST